MNNDILEETEEKYKKKRERLNKKVKYEERIVLFLDILGFQKKLGQKNCQEMYDVLIFLQENIKEDVGCLESRKFSIFSDCICISCDANEKSAVYYMIYDIFWFYHILLSHGMLPRGAIAIGDLFHDENIIFGQALVDAYTLENKCALYPRIVISEEVIEKGKKNLREYEDNEEMASDFDKIVQMDSDGLFYVDYFSAIEKEVFWDSSEYLFEYLPRLKQIIEEGLKNPKKDIWVKYNWMKQKYNILYNILENNLKRLPKSFFLENGMKLDTLLSSLKLED